jgi:alpha-L-fucosidase
MGPKRDVAAELLASSKKLPKKMYFIMSSHRAWHFAFYDTGRKDNTSDVEQCQCPQWQDGEIQGSQADPFYCQLYCPANKNETTPTTAFMTDWLLRTCELTDIYRPDVLYFDWWIGVSPLWQPFLEKFTAFYYNRLLMDGKVGVITTKGTTMPPGADVLDFERGQACAIQKRYWQTDTSISVNSWGYIDNDIYKSAPDMLHSLIDIVSKNGGLLLNVGPPPNGTIPIAAQATFLNMGDWLKTNGDAIYKTRPYHLFGEGTTQVPCGSFSDTSKNFTNSDFRFTINPASNTLYVLCMGAKAGDKILIKSLGASRVGTGSITTVNILSLLQPVIWTSTASGLEVTLPSTLPVAPGLPPVLSVVGLSDIQWDGIVRQGQDNSINLYATLANSFTGNVVLDVSGDFVTASKWGSATGAVQWLVKIREGGNYKVSVLSAEPSSGLLGEISVQNQNQIINIPRTASSTVFAKSNSVPVTLSAGNSVLIQFKLQNPQLQKGFELATVQLVPA